MTASTTVIPGLNHTFAGARLTTTDLTVVYQATEAGGQFLWMAAHNNGGSAVTITFTYYQKSTGNSYPVKSLTLAAGTGDDHAIPGLPMFNEDEIRVQISTAVALGVDVPLIIHEFTPRDQG